MQRKTLFLIIVIGVIGASSSAMARGGGGGGGGGSSAGSHGGHGHFGHFGHRFQRNPVFFGDGWGWGPYSGNGANTNILVSQQPLSPFPAADITGSFTPSPCRWNEQTFTVPSSGGGTRRVQVVNCH
jgi:hypothetical protein